MKWAFLLLGATVIGLGCAGGRDDGPSAVCEPTCPIAQTCCGTAAGAGVCSFPDSDPRNCGGCGVACGAGERCDRGSCVAATCTPECAGVQTCCSAICAFTDSDRNNCGSCGNRCLAGQNCVSGMCTGMAIDSGPPIDTGPPGMCMPTCSSAQRCCVTTCVGRDVPSGTDGRADSSFDNCNGCGLACDEMRASSCSRPPGGGAAPSCMCGNFAQCLAGEVCASSGGMLRCISLQSDPENCGTIGNVCGEGEVCRMGMCGCGSTGAPCAAGTSCCGGACIGTSADNANCGGCGTVCPGDTTCSASMCLCGGAMGRACRPAAMMDLGEICCADTCVPQDAMNCGGCGMACEDDDMCILADSFPPTGMLNPCCAPSGFPFPFCIPTGGGFGDAGFPFP